MALEFSDRAATRPDRVALFPGAWNPPTLAHVEIARAARSWADEVIWVLPRALPHKRFDGAGFETRRRMLQELVQVRAGEGFSMAVSEGGLYAEIADEARLFFGDETEIALVCGRDAAERMASWNYGAPGVFDEMLRRYRLLVATRRGDYEPVGHHSERILKLPIQAAWDEVSSSEVRRRISSGEDWRTMVPPELAAIVQELYFKRTNP